MTIDEFRYALAVRSEHNSLEDLSDALESNVIFYLQKFLDDFVVISDVTIYLRHQSVKEFFLGSLDSSYHPQFNQTDDSYGVYLEFRTSLETAHNIMATSCIRFLNLQEFNQRTVADDHRNALEVLPFPDENSRSKASIELVSPTFKIFPGIYNGPWTEYFRYAAANWAYHFAACSQSDEILEGALALSSKPATLANWSEWFRRAFPNEPDLPDRLDQLLVAAYFGHGSVVQKFLVADPVERRLSSTSLGLAITWASRMGHVEIVNMLLNAGVDASSHAVEGRSALCWAANGGFIEIVRILLSSSQDLINKQDAHGYTSLLCAIIEEHANVVELLLNQPTVDVKVLALKVGRGTPGILHAVGTCDSSRSGRKIFEMLLRDQRVDLLAHDNRGQTLLSWAAEAGDSTALRMLLECRERSNEVALLFADRSHKYSKSLLALAAERGHVDFIRTLCISKRVDDQFRWVDLRGQNAFHIAARREFADVIRVLAEYDPDGVDQRDETGSTPLATAMWARSESVVRALMDTHRVAVNTASYSGRTAISYGASGGSSHMIRILVEDYGADINIPDNDGKTPLWWATAVQDSKMIDELKRLGAK